MIVYLTIAARHILAPSDEGAVERSETEGEINKEYQYISLPPSRLTPCHLPRQREVLAVAIRKINFNLFLSGFFQQIGSNFLSCLLGVIAGYDVIADIGILLLRFQGHNAFYLFIQVQGLLQQILQKCLL